MREVRQDEHADSDCDPIANLDSVGIGGLDQRVEADPGSAADLHASPTVQHRPDGVAAGTVEGSQLQDAVLDTGEVIPAHLPFSFCATYDDSGPTRVRSSGASSSKSNSR